MHDEDGFLNKLLENPTDDTVRLVYADWLDERGDDESKMKSQFLRLTVQLLETERPNNPHADRRKEMQPLAAKLPTDWLAVVSRLKVEQCPAKIAEWDEKTHTGLRFEFVCDKHWDEMTPTEGDAVRHCEQCKKDVHYCDTLSVARRHAEQGHCIAIDLGVIRRQNDLNSQIFWTGQPSAEDIWKAELDELDTVSREREEQKRKASQTGSTE